jgi:hypothetical protein
VEKGRNIFLGGVYVDQLKLKQKGGGRAVRYFDCPPIEFYSYDARKSHALGLANQYVSPAESACLEFGCHSTSEFLVSQRSHKNFIMSSQSRKGGPVVQPAPKRKADRGLG